MDGLLLASLFLLPKIAAIDPIGGGASAAAIISVVVALIGGLGALARTYFTNQRLAGVMAAKDEIIRTNGLAIDAFEDRISTLEFKLTELRKELDERDRQIQALTEQVEQLRTANKHLEKYTAPEVFPVIESALQDHTALLAEIKGILTNPPDVSSPRP